MHKPKKNTLHIAEEYARDVVKRRIPAGKYHILACKRFLEDLRKCRRKRHPDGWEWRYDEEAAEKAHRFIELLPHVDGEKARRGERLRLEPFQVFIIANLFGFVHRDTGLRRFFFGYIEMPRGNGKSYLLSAIGIYLAFVDAPPGAESYSAATSQKQARIIYDTARRIIDAEPKLKEALGIQTYLKVIERPSKGQTFEPLPAIPRDGKRPFATLVDELHEHPDDRLWNSLAQSMGKIPGNLMLAITTAGLSVQSFCFRYRSDICRILEGEVRDDRTFGIIFHADEDDDWTSEDAIVKANPGLHVTVSLDVILAERDKALRDPHAEFVYKAKRLCIWSNAKSGYFNISSWNDGAYPADDLLTPGVWHLGADLAAKQDLCAVVAAKYENDNLYVWSHFFLPERTAERVAHLIPYKEYARQGWITITPGAVTDFAFVEKYIDELYRKLKAKDVTFDPTNASQPMVNLRKRRLNVIEISSKIQHMSEPMTELGKLIADGRVIHSGNPIMTAHIANTKAFVDGGERVRPIRDKNDPTSKIDGTVALLNALSRIIADNLQAAKGSPTVRFI